MKKAQKIITSSNLSLLVLLGLFFSTVAAADVEQEMHTFYMEVTGGFSIHKSEMINNNDTSVTSAIKFGSWAGHRHNLGMYLQQEQATVAFELNQGSLQVTHQEYGLLYRMGPFYMGGGFNKSTWVASRPDSADAELAAAGATATADEEAEPFLDMTTSGFVGSAGGFLPLGKPVMLFMEAKSVSTNAVQDSIVERSDGSFTEADENLAVGSSVEATIGGRLNFTRNVLRGVIGFRLRNYTMTVKDVTYTEQHTNTFVGLLAGWDF
jgi:hypothetical protein